MRFRLVALSLLLLALPTLGQQNSRPLVPNSPKGFDKQYKSVFKAYEKGDEKELLERFGAFAIPERWFTDEFGPEQGSKFARQYLYQFRNFELDTVQEFNRVTCGYYSCDRGDVKTSAAKASAGLAQASPGRTSSLSLVPVKRFRIEHYTPPEVNPCFSDTELAGSCTFYPSGTMYDNSWVSSFIYMDGAFRFVGWTFPFWDPCGANQPIPESELNKPPEPVHFNLMQKPQSRDLLALMAKPLGKNH